MPKRSRILYDPQMFDMQNYGGISRYFANLIEGINKTKKFKAELPLVYSTNYYVRNFPQLLNNWLGKKLLKKAYKRKRWNLYLASYKVRRTNFDILHATYYNPYLLKDLKKPLVLTVHDMIHENFSHLFENAEKAISDKKTMIEAADLIIAISAYTKQEILRYYPDLAAKIRVVYHGLPEIEIFASTDILPKRFLLYVGDRYAQYKNFRPLINAISRTLSEQEDLYLICAGGGEFNPEEAEFFERLGISQKTSQISASDSQLIQLFQNALAFMYPSLEEGFGLPILEAFKNGCPVSCSNTSCLPEVGGNAVSYFSPDDPQSIHQTILELISDIMLREKRIQDGYEQLKKFTFEGCLNQTMDCYSSLL